MKMLIKGGFLIDPANQICSKQDILTEDGKVSRILPAAGERGTEGDASGGAENGAAETAGAESAGADAVIDASGRVVCPGFVDIHMHEDPVGPDGEIALAEETSIFCCMLRMGVTTAVGGNCGSNACDPLRYLEIVDRGGAPVNVGLLAGHNYFRAKAGCTDRYAPASKEQTAWIGRSVAEALRGGCLGVSYGIRYAPGMDLREMLASAGACADERRGNGPGKLAAAHIRDDAAAVFAAADEFLELGRRLGIRLQVSHIGSMAGFGQMERFLAMLERERGNGLDVACDCYPYDAFCTEIGATTYDDGWMERYQCGYDAIEASEGAYKGRRLDRDSFRQLRRDCPEMLTVGHVMDSRDVEMALKAPGVMLGSDGILDMGQGHPRAAGAFPRLIAAYVRTGKMTMYDAVARMTALPAERLGLSAKGNLSVGADADMVIFDPETIEDQATFERPLLPPKGIDYVLVGGRVAVKDGRIVDGRLGRSVRR